MVPFMSLKYAVNFIPIPNDQTYAINMMVTPIEWKYTI